MGLLIPLLLPLIPGLIQTVEAIFQKPKSGTDKMSAVLAALRGILTQMFAAGQVPAGVPVDSAGKPIQPTDATMQGIIETVLAQLKASGQMTQSTPGGSLYLLQGAVTALKAA